MTQHVPALSGKPSTSTSEEPTCTRGGKELKLEERHKCTYQGKGSFGRCEKIFCAPSYLYHVEGESTCGHVHPHPLKDDKDKEGKQEKWWECKECLCTEHWGKKCKREGLHQSTSTVSQRAKTH